MQEHNNFITKTDNPTLADCDEKSNNQLWNLVNYNVEQLPQIWFQIMNLTSKKCLSIDGNGAKIIQFN